MNYLRAWNRLFVLGILTLRGSNDLIYFDRNLTAFQMQNLRSLSRQSHRQPRFHSEARLLGIQM